MDLFKLRAQDVVKGIVVAVLAVFLGALQQAVFVHGLDFMAFDWVGILNVSWQAAIAYLAKNFLTDREGNIHLGVVKLGAKQLSN